MILWTGWTGCGVKAPPRPPERLPPAVVKDLSGVVDRGVMHLMWGIPAEDEAAGAPVEFVVYRSKTPVEAAECRDCPLIFTQVAQLPVTATDRRTGRMTYSEPLEKGYRYGYKLRSVDAFGVGSEDSNTFFTAYCPGNAADGNDRNGAVIAMNKIPFYKMCGSGNDFIIVDNRRKVLPEDSFPGLARRLCARTMSLGADGFVVVDDSPTADFRWHFFNSDGSRADMCGNGARCVARFATLNGIAGPDMTFDTGAGTIAARVTGELVKIRMTEPRAFKAGIKVETSRGPLTVSCIDTGVPHAVIEVTDIEQTDVVGLGRELRYHDTFAPAGTNVNFVFIHADGRMFNRTYERGVEGETLACGTGCVAAALILSGRTNMTPPITVIPRSGEPLAIYFKKTGGRFSDVFLEGNARIICTGELWEDAWRWGAPETASLQGHTMKIIT